MNHLNCEIIKDLIPSYLDEICSESSKKAVKEHLTQCSDCRRYLEELQCTEISAKPQNHGELDYMKKVKRHYTQKNVLGIILLFILSQAVLWNLSEIHNLKTEVIQYCTIFAILTLGTFLLLTNYREKPKMNMGRMIAGILSVLGFPFCFAIGILTNRAMTTGIGPFGLKLKQTGPFLNRWLIFIVIAELLLFAYYTIDAIRNTHMLGILPTVSLMCCTLCMSYRSVLFLMDIPEPSDFIRLALIVFLLAVVLVSIEVILTRIYTSSDKKLSDGPLS